jgi:outer membrane protein OmpA-like peptidoglycan-associated protein
VNARALGTGFVLMTMGLALAPRQAVAQDAPAANRPPLASVESRWSDVYCDLTELSRTGTSELTVRYRYRNTRKNALSLPHGNLVPRTRVFDPASRTLFGVLNDASGNPVSSTMMNGQAARPVPANGTQVHWARLQAPPDSVGAVTVLVEGCLPFDDVRIGGSSSATPLTTPPAAIASQEGEAEGVTAEITSARRTPGGLVLVTFRYRNTGAKPFPFPHDARVQGAYFLDSANRKKYEVVRDQHQLPLCSETKELVGQSGERLPAGTAIGMWAVFNAPAESTKTIAVTVPFAPPFNDVPLSGAASGAGASTSVSGAVIGLEAALKDLGATVTETEIRIDLSADVLFDFDKSDIKKEAEPSLQKVATVLGANPSSKVTIEGHTDGKGADAYNQTLSEQRAASVKQWLVANAKVNGASVTTKGWGKTKPIAHNTKPDGSDDPEGRAKNRRVEIVVRKGA